MELLPPYSASLGAMGSLAGKLDALLDTKLKDGMEKVGIRLLKLSKAPDPPLTARCWMKDVRQMSYDMDNYVATESDWIQKLPGVFGARVKEANRRYNRYKLKRVPSCRDVFPIIDHQLPSVVHGGRETDPVVVGLHEEGGVFDRLCPLLTDGDEQLKVLSIVGVGGIGKSTLAKQLWRQHEPGDYFDCRAFVRTAKKPDMRRIFRSILAQVRPHQPPDASEVHDLIHDLTQHLQDKRYFVIIDDLWATSVWDVARRAFPESTGSRILTTTEIENVALSCSSYQSGYIFKMQPLSLSHSKELFTSGMLGSGKAKSPLLDEMADEIIRRCGGLPLAIICISSVISRQGEANIVHKREQIQTNLPTNTTPNAILKQVLNFCYNCLPSCLQTCLLYLSLYAENYIMLKEDIVKQWVSEGFILAPTENEKMKVAGNYFDKLFHMGLIQLIDVDYSDDVLYYAVHHTVYDFITSKSIEENFVTPIDYSQRSVGFSNKATRLSLQFGSATYATAPECIGLSQVRSLVFIGLKNCVPSILEFKLLRFLTIHMWADQPSTGVDLKPMSELVLLRSLQVTCNDTIHLPDMMEGTIHLEILEINARVADIPANIVHLRSWLHLRLGVGTELPDLTGTLKMVTVSPPISLDESSSPPDSVRTIDLLSPISTIPRWIEQLTNLCILKFVVRELQRDGINNLQGLPFLTVLSLRVQRQTREQIRFATGAFIALENFEFRCGVLRLMFQEGTMPNLQRLKLGFNAQRGEQYGSWIDGIEHLLKVQEISGIIGSVAGAEELHWWAAESAFKDSIGKHPSNVSIKRVDIVEEEYSLPEKQHLVKEKHKFVEDIKKSRESQFIQSPTASLQSTSSSERRGRIVFSSTYRPQVPFDIFSCRLSSLCTDAELHLTDGLSYNYNGSTIPPAALKTLLNKTNLEEQCNVTGVDVDVGNVFGIVFVSERDDGLETLYMSIYFKANNKVKVFSLADIFGDADFSGTRLEDSGCIGGGYPLGSRTVDYCLIYVSTKEPVQEGRNPWTVVYKTNLATGKTERITPKGAFDLNPSVSPSGKTIAMASFQGKSWNNEIENLKTDIYVMNVDSEESMDLGRKLLIKNGGWPTWGSDNVIFFHRGTEKFLPSGRVETAWGVFRYTISSEEMVQVTPDGLDAMTPAAIDETKVAVATIRQKSRYDDVRVEAQYRHIEIFDTNVPGLPPVQITQKTRPESDHYNPFVMDGGRRIGYHRCSSELLQQGGQVFPNLNKLGSPVKDVGLFRLSGVFPTVSKDGSKLAFTNKEFKEVWVADNQGLRIVYEERGPNNVFSPVWNQNPDKDILYVCIGTSFDAREPLEIYTISNASGPVRKVERLTHGMFNNAFPSSSPDGNKCVFRSTRDGGEKKHKNLYIIWDTHAAESEEGWVTRLTKGPWTDTHCQWSPNGDWIVFSSTRDKLASSANSKQGHDLDSGYFSLYLVKPTDPTVLIRLMNSGDNLGGYINHPVFSPDGRSIAVTADLAAVSVDPISLPRFLHAVRPYGDIFVVDVDIDPEDPKKSKGMKGVRRITHSRYECGTPAWTTTLLATDSNAQWSMPVNMTHSQLFCLGSEMYEPPCPYNIHRNRGNSWQMTGHLCVPKRGC